MRIAYVSVDPGVSVFGPHGASVHIQEIVREFAAQGHEVTIFTTRRGNLRHRLAELANIELIETTINHAAAVKREQSQREIAHDFGMEIIRRGFDLVYERYSLFSTVLAEVNQPGVLEVNSPLLDLQRAHRDVVDYKAAENALIKQVTAAVATVCVSDPLREWVLRQVPGARAHTVPNGVNTSRIFPQPEDAGQAVVTFVGSLKPWHGVEYAIWAAAVAQEQWQLRIVGDGPQRVPLMDLAQKLRVDADFRGAVSPSEIPGQLRGSAIGVAPYPETVSAHHYFSPLQVYEYLAAGLPIVASNIGQIPQAVGDAGVLVPGSNASALAQAIDNLVYCPLRRWELGAQARRQALRHCTWSGVVRTIVDLVGQSSGMSGWRRHIGHKGRHMRGTAS